MADPDARRRDADNAVTPRGFATRAIRAAHRIPVVDQSPTSVPIYQTVTFASDDAEELGAVATRAIPGYAYGRLDNPTVVAFAAAVAELVLVPGRRVWLSAKATDVSAYPAP